MEIIDLTNEINNNIDLMDDRSSIAIIDFIYGQISFSKAQEKIDHTYSDYLLKADKLRLLLNKLDDVQKEAYSDWQNELIDEDDLINMLN